MTTWGLFNYFFSLSVYFHRFMDQDDYVMLIELFCPLGVYFYHYMDTDDYFRLY